MKIPRFYASLKKYITPKKALIIYGPRQVGKTTLVTDFLAKTNYRYILARGEDLRAREVLGSSDLKTLNQFISGKNLLIIDEAQKIPHIGESLKLLIDSVDEIAIIATGSSSFELAGQIGEPLVGRKKTLILYPVAIAELKGLFNEFEINEQMENFLVYGAYPKVLSLSKRDDKIDMVNDIAYSYLLKDILELERVKGSKVLIDLLRLIAYQIGNEVSLSEIGAAVGLDYKTVARYLDLLEKSFVLYNLRGFSRNLRSEITRKSKYYFYDLGVRNALVANFNDLAIRNDVGQLWENFLFMERLKKRSYKKLHANTYFWRTWQGQEIDLIEEHGGKLYGYEFKWGKKSVKPPRDWIKAYTEGVFSTFNRENYWEFIT